MKAVSYEKAGEFLAGLSRAIVVCHVGPDVDAYGSMCAVGLALEKLGKEVLLLNESPLVQNLCFLAGTDRIVHTLPDDWEDVSAVICDCGDEKRVGDSLRSSIFNGKRETLNIDHHISNDYFASSNAVYPEASSTCEIVFEILSAMGILIDSSIAQCLFAGISGDTGSFQYSSTSARTFQVAHELVKLGADPYGVYLQMYASTPLKVFQLQTHALNQIQFHFDNRLAELLIDEATFEKFGVTDDELQKIQESALRIEGVLISCFVRQVGDLWKVSLRAKGKVLDVSTVAKAFGGGGHKAAAAFRTRSEISEIRKKMLGMCSQILGDV